MLLARSRLGLLLLGALLAFLLYLLLPAARRSRPDEGKRGWRAANGTVRTGMAAGEPPVFYREVPAAAVGPGRWVSPPAWGVAGPGVGVHQPPWSLDAAGMAAFLNPFPPVFPHAGPMSCSCTARRSPPRRGRPWAHWRCSLEKATVLSQ